MTHPALDIANALTAELNAATFSQPFTAVCKFVPFYPEEDLQTLRVTVVPKSYEETNQSRQSSVLTISVDVAVQKKLADIEADSPAMLDLVSDILVCFKGRTLTACPYARWVESKNEPLFSPEHLGQYKVFTGVLTLTYRMVRDD